MDTVDLNLSTPGEVSIAPETNSTVTVSIDEVKKSDVLDHFDVEDAIAHFGAEALLKEMGEDKAIEYFELEIKED